jgi:uncharacterized SAM-binding protein YcdF (DUF218 family)
MTYTEPLLAVFLFLAIAALVLLRWHKRNMLLTLGIIGLFFVSWPPADWLLSRPLEARYPVRPFASTPVQAIVVLSSAVQPPNFERPYLLPDGETYERCQYAAWIHRSLPGIPVLVCGGIESRNSEPDAVVMGHLLEQAGVSSDSIWSEDRSRSTYENALFGSQILKSKGIQRIALVVDATSMPRAEACFRKQGITVFPAPCRFRQFGSLAGELLPSWQAIRHNEVTLHETLGYGWYWLRGWV